MPLLSTFRGIQRPDVSRPWRLRFLRGCAAASSTSPSPAGGRERTHATTHEYTKAVAKAKAKRHRKQAGKQAAIAAASLRFRFRFSYTFIEQPGSMGHQRDKTNRDRSYDSDKNTVQSCQLFMKRPNPSKKLHGVTLAGITTCQGKDNQQLPAEPTTRLKN